MGGIQVIYKTKDSGKVLETSEQPAISFGQKAVKIKRGDSANVQIALSCPSSQPISVEIVPAEGTAIAGHDFTIPNATLTFTPGETEQSVLIETHDNSDNGQPAGERRAVLHLENAEGAAFGDLRRALLVIEDSHIDNPNVFIDLAEMQSTRYFAEAQDWRGKDALVLRYCGTGSGNPVRVALLDNRMESRTAQADDPVLMWHDEFDGEAGSRPDPRFWGYDIGDGLLVGNPGWGNAEREYYTDENAVTDGQGNLVITAPKLEPGSTDLLCWYGPAEYTSSRLSTFGKVELTYGRVEARMKLPWGQGIWPAFWALGTNINDVPWPHCGEIDIMEFIGREPKKVHGTLHGPGYSGAEGITKFYEIPSGTLSDDFHVFAVDWEKNSVTWSMDGMTYCQRTPKDLPKGTKWVFDHPHFLLLNLAVGGGWPGYPDHTSVFPQSLVVDYVRIYQNPASFDRFEATFTDDFTGWQDISLPLDSFASPEGLKRGLNLSAVWGYAVNSEV